jgi:hypothetical protein
MRSKHSWQAPLGLSLAVGCQSPDKGYPGPPQISVIVNATRVEVSARQPGSCSVVADAYDPGVCETARWGFSNGFPTPFARLDCLPDPTCVKEVRLERAGTVLAIEEGPYATFSMPITGDETVVILGCGEPLRMDLPPPLSGVELAVESKSDGIHVDATGEGVQSTLGRASSLSYSDGFNSACLSSSGSVTLPTSPDYDTYTVESFGLGEPVVLEGGSVRVYPARRREELVSTVLPLGPIWQATVAAARLSPHFELCDSHCSAFLQACYPTANRDQCNVSCVAQFTLRPSCADEFESNLKCRRAALVCDTNAGQGGAPPACAAESAAYAACVGPAESPPQMETN